MMLVFPPSSSLLSFERRREKEKTRPCILQKKDKGFEHDIPTEKTIL